MLLRGSIAGHHRPVDALNVHGEPVKVLRDYADGAGRTVQEAHLRQLFEVGFDGRVQAVALPLVLLQDIRIVRERPRAVPGPAEDVATQQAVTIETMSLHRQHITLLIGLCISRHHLLDSEISRRPVTFGDTFPESRGVTFPDRLGEGLGDVFTNSSFLVCI